MRHLVTIALGLLALALTFSCGGGSAPAAPKSQATQAAPEKITPPSAVPAVEPAPAAKGANVILISIDTLRADALGSYGAKNDPTPVLDRLAKEGVRFDAAYSTTSWTAPSMASLITGLYPQKHGVRDGVVERAAQAVRGQQVLAADLPRLAERFRAAGYRTYGLTANGHLAEQFGFAQGFDVFECIGFRDGPVVAKHFEIFATEIMKPSDAPYFLWIHLLDPHVPYLAFPPFMERAWDPRPRFSKLDRVAPPERYESMQLEGAPLQYVRTLYASEVHYADSLVGRMLERLDAWSGARHRALVVALSDHGEAFGEHGHFGHGNDLFDETVRIPLIMRWPDRAYSGTTVRTLASLVDVMPTLSAALGLVPAGSAEQDGVSLVPAIAASTHAQATDAARTLFADLRRSNQTVSARQSDFKLIRSFTRKHDALYDLARDPGELRDVSAEHPDKLATLAASLDAFLRAAPTRKAAVKAIDERELRTLKSLGYAQ